MAYAYYASITIDATKVSGSSNLPNFPMLVSGTYDGTGDEPDIRTTANSGHVRNTASGGNSGSITVPADLVFSPNTDGSSKYSFEIESYNATTGAIRAWVKIPTLDYDDNTTLYMCYGDADVTTSQEDVAGTWTQFKMVLHFNDSAKDSVGNVDLTAYGTPTYTTSDHGKAVVLNGTDQYFEERNNSSIQVPVNSACYLEVVGKADINNAYMHPLVLMKNSATYPGSFVMNIAFAIQNAGKMASNTRNDAWIVSNSAVGTSAYRHMVWSFNGTNEIFYTLDGTADGDPAENSINASTEIDTIDVGVSNGDWSGPGGLWDGNFAELRFGHNHLGQDWGATSSNSILAPSTFYAMGDETSTGPAPIVKAVSVLELASSAPSVKERIRNKKSVSFMPLMNKAVLGRGYVIKNSADTDAYDIGFDNDMMEL